MSVATSLTTERLVAELYKSECKAEIVDGRVVMMSPTGDQPAHAGGAIFASLRAYEKNAGGRAYPDNAAFVVDLSNRKSFSPDAAFYVGPRTGGKFLQGAPVFAAEVRSEGDYGATADRRIAAKRSDYFAAGTIVVWDVDVLQGETVMVYRSHTPDKPTTYRRGETAEAEPAVPGWKFSVDELFD